ncbi:uncharacterized protein G2W53_020617 [Senna tora]|uniref:Uncharacterized protein n=1 Tax=Senna tora TaxID=362788 RepID=A0A834TI38_9FABA|nr:uncharacterized protein G2W53_020617 [Senna tora]
MVLLDEIAYDTASITIFNDPNALGIGCGMNNVVEHWWLQHRSIFKMKGQFWDGLFKSLIIFTIKASRERFSVLPNSISPFTDMPFTLTPYDPTNTSSVYCNGVVKNDFVACAHEHVNHVSIQVVVVPSRDGAKSSVSDGFELIEFEVFIAGKTRIVPVHQLQLEWLRLRRFLLLIGGGHNEQDEEEYEEEERIPLQCPHLHRIIKRMQQCK